MKLFRSLSPFDQKWVKYCIISILVMSLIASAFVYGLDWSWVGAAFFTVGFGVVIGSIWTFSHTADDDNSSNQANNASDDVHSR